MTIEDDRNFRHFCGSYETEVEAMADFAIASVMAQNKIGRRLRFECNGIALLSLGEGSVEVHADRAMQTGNRVGSR